VPEKKPATKWEKPGASKTWKKPEAPQTPGKKPDPKNPTAPKQS
jgi:hypothetical protein